MNPASTIPPCPECGGEMREWGFPAPGPSLLQCAICELIRGCGWRGDEPAPVAEGMSDGPYSDEELVNLGKVMTDPLTKFAPTDVLRHTIGRLFITLADQRAKAIGANRHLAAAYEAAGLSSVSSEPLSSAIGKIVAERLGKAEKYIEAMEEIACRVSPLREHYAARDAAQDAWREIVESAETAALAARDAGEGKQA